MDNKLLLAEYKTAIFIRCFETRLLKLFSEGRINGTVHTCVGEELNGVVLSKYLKEGDYFLSNHRGHGHFIARTGNAKGLMAEMMGKVTGISHGYGGSQHLLTDGHVSNGVQGGMTPIAAGIALSYKLDNKDNIAVSFLGDGTMGEGLVYESFNIAAKWNLPVLYVLENNHYAQSTACQQTLSGDISKRAAGFGLKYLKTNVWDIEDLNKTIEDAISVTRRGTPTLLEIDCYRLNSHSKGDDNRNPEEVEEYKKKDLINVFAQEHPEEYSEYIAEAEKKLDEIIESVSSDSTLETVDNESMLVNRPYTLSAFENTTKLRGGESIHQALLKLFNDNSGAVLLGEDVINKSEYTGKEYGGAFKVTKELSDIYPSRVLSTPISEQAIIGIGVGLAFMGHLALSEIMFGDFMTLTLDQLLQHASKFAGQYGRKVNMPLVVRTPMGGRRGYGPTHSQSIEKHFLGIPNVDMIALNNAIEPSEIYAEVFRDLSQPLIVIENKVLYTHIGFKRKEGFSLLKSDEKYPTVVYRPDSTVTHLTIACYGGMLEIVKEAVEELAMEDIICEVVSPTQICPLNVAPFANSVNKSGRLLIVEEGSSFAAWSSELCAGLMEQGCKVTKLERLANNAIIPCSKPAEDSLLVNKNQVVGAIKKMISWN